MRIITLLLPLTMASAPCCHPRTRNAARRSSRNKAAFAAIAFRERGQHRRSRPGANRGSKFHSGTAGQHDVEPRTHDVVRYAAARPRYPAAVRTGCRRSLRLFLLGPIL